MLISTRGRYALRMLIDVAGYWADGAIPLKEVAKRQEISEKYLEAILKMLVKNGVIVGTRGKSVGYRFNRPAEQGEVLQMMGESLASVSCLEEGAAVCPRVSQCRTLPLWQGLGRAILEYLDQYTIADLIQ